MNDLKKNKTKKIRKQKKIKTYPGDQNFKF